MSNMHTPGPWIAHQEAHGLFVSAGSFCIARLGDGNSEGQQANASLIAAAPDLLEALKLAADHGPSLPCYVADQIIAAIAKSTGQ